MFVFSRPPSSSSNRRPPPQSSPPATAPPRRSPARKPRPPARPLSELRTNTSIWAKVKVAVSKKSFQLKTSRRRDFFSSFSSSSIYPYLQARHKDPLGFRVFFKTVYILARSCLAEMPLHCTCVNFRRMIFNLFFAYHRRPLPAPVREAGTGQRRRMLLLLPGEDGVDRGQEAVRTHGGGSEVSRRLIKKPNGDFSFSQYI